MNTTCRVSHVDEAGHRYEDEIEAPSWRLATLAVQEAGGVILELEILREGDPRGRAGRLKDARIAWSATGAPR
jgi:hypothetical protein